MKFFSTARGRASSTFVLLLAVACHFSDLVSALSEELSDDVGGGSSTLRRGGKANNNKMVVMMEEAKNNVNVVAAVVEEDTNGVSFTAEDAAMMVVHHDDYDGGHQEKDYDITSRHHLVRELGGSDHNINWSEVCQESGGRTHGDTCDLGSNGEKACCGQLYEDDNGETHKLICSEKSGENSKKRCRQVHSDDIKWSRLCYRLGPMRALKGEVCSSNFGCCFDQMKSYDYAIVQGESSAHYRRVRVREYTYSLACKQQGGSSEMRCEEVEDIVELEY